MFLLFAALDNRFPRRQALQLLPTATEAAYAVESLPARENIDRLRIAGRKRCHLIFGLDSANNLILRMDRSISSPSDIVDHFRNRVPHRLLVEMLKSGTEACRRAHDVARGLVAQPHAEDLIPPLRRAMFEHAIGSLAIRGVAASVRATKASSYVQLDVAGVSLTALTRSSMPWTLEEAHYRNTLAREAQDSFSFIEKHEPPPNAQLYAVFIYGGPLNVPDLSLAQIVFPLPDGSIPVRTRIDLLRRDLAVLEEDRPTISVLRARPRARDQSRDS